jgi:hypothetical protein
VIEDEKRAKKHLIVIGCPFLGKVVVETRHRLPFSWESERKLRLYRRELNG